MARNDTFYNRAATLVDPARVRAESEDNLLGVADFEGQPPVGGAPNPVPQLAQPAPAISSESLGTTATPTVQGVESLSKPAEAKAAAMYALGFPQADVDEATNRFKNLGTKVAQEGGGLTPSKLVSAAPSWYKAGKPPATHSGWATAMDALGNALAAGPEQRLKDPRRNPYDKQKDANQAALARGLSGLFSHLFTKGRGDYERDQAAATKDAGLLRTIPGGKTRTQQELDATKAYLDLAHHQRGMDDLAKNRAFNQSIETAKHDPNDPEAQALSKSLIAAGFPPEQVRDMSKDMLKARMATINTQMQTEAKAGQSEVDAQNKERQTILEAYVAQQRELDKELRAEVQRRGESYVPEMRWVNNTPPSDRNVTDVRELYKMSRGFDTSLQRMEEIQTRLTQLVSAYAKQTGKEGTSFEDMLNMMGPVAGWVRLPGFGAEGHALVNEAVALQTFIQNLIRSEAYSNLGVMQRWEDIKTKAQIPVAGSPTAFFRGVPQWRALRKNAQQLWVDGVHAYGGLLPDEQDPGSVGGAATPEQRIRERPAPALPPRAKYNARDRKIETTPDAPTVPAGDTLGDTGAKAPPIPSDARKAAPLPAGQKRYKITFNGKTETHPLTPEKAERLSKKPGYQVVEVP